MTKKHPVGNRSNHCFVHGAVGQCQFVLTLRGYLNKHTTIPPTIGRPSVLPAAVPNKRLVQHPDVRWSPLPGLVGHGWFLSGWVVTVICMDEALARMEVDLSLPSWMDDAPTLRGLLCDMSGLWPDTLPGTPA